MAAVAVALDRLAAASNSVSGAALSQLSRELQLPNFSEVFRGHELTRKDHRLPSGIPLLDCLIDGGIARGRLSEILGPAGSGRTTLAASFAASATRRGEVIAWIDSAGALDPASIAAAGVDLTRVLWVSLAKCRGESAPSPWSGRGDRWRAPSRTGCISDDLTSDPFPKGKGNQNGKEARTLKAAEMVLKAGGFGLLVIDFGDSARPLTQSAALRLARAAERCGAAVLALASRRLCGTFSALSLSLVRSRARFSRLAPGAPVLFDGFTFETRVARNKLGPMGQRAIVHAMVDPVMTQAWVAFPSEYLTPDPFPVRLRSGQA